MEIGRGVLNLVKIDLLQIRMTWLTLAFAPVCLATFDQMAQESARVFSVYRQANVHKALISNILHITCPFGTQHA